MAYSKKVSINLKKTLNEPAKFNVGRFKLKDTDGNGTFVLQPVEM